MYTAVEVATGNEVAIKQMNLQQQPKKVCRCTHALGGVVIIIIIIIIIIINHLGADYK